VSEPTTSEKLWVRSHLEVFSSLFWARACVALVPMVLFLLNHNRVSLGQRQHVLLPTDLERVHIILVKDQARGAG